MGMASSASTVNRSGLASAKPPSTKRRVSPLTRPPRMSMTPGLSVEINGMCPASTPKSPSAPGTVTISATSETRSRSGETISKAILSMISGRFGRELLGLGDGVLDGAHHVEGGFGQVIVFAVHHRLEAANSILQLDTDTSHAGEHGRRKEWLRQEALDLSSARHRQFVF